MSITLDGLIRSVITSTESTDTAEIVEQVVEAIDPSDYPALVRQAVQARLSSNMGYLRAMNAPPIRRGVSTKQSLIRDEYWPAFLAQKITLPGGVKAMADATVDDLRYLAGFRRQQAQGLLTEGDQFDTLADLMVRSRVKKLADLGASQASKVLGRAA